jgi:O-antigen ligase
VSDHHTQLSVAHDALSLTADEAVQREAFRVDVEGLRRRCAAWGISGFGALVGGLVVFAPLIDGGTTQFPVLVIRWLLLAGGVIWLLNRMKVGEVFLPHLRLDLCGALFVAWTILTLAWSPYKNASLQWVLSVLSYAAFFVIVAHGLPSRRQARAQASLVMLVGLCEGLWGIVQYVWLGEARARGTFFNPNFFAAYESAVFVLALAVLFFTERKALTQTVARSLWVVAAVSLAANIMAQSRGASAAMVATALCLGVFRYGKNAIAATGLCVLAILVVPNPLQHRILHAEAQDPYAYMRFEIWKSAVLRLADQPLGIGVGMFKQGSFRDRFPIDGDIVRYRKRPESAHNEYLQIGVELGIVGLVLFFGAVWLWAAELREILRTPDQNEDHGLLIGAAAAAVLLLLHATVDSTFHEPALVILLLLMGALVHRRYVQVCSEGGIWRRIRFRYHPLRVVSVVAGALLIAAVCAQSTVAWYAHEAGKHHAAQGDHEGALTWYVHAANIDPGTTGYHDSIARTTMQLFSLSRNSEWLIKAAEEEAIARKLNPVDGRFPFRAGTVYRLMASQTATRTQRADLLAKAAEAFSEAIRLDPYSPFAYYELAQLRLAEGRVEEAIELLSTAMVYEPYFLPGRALRAELSLKAGIPGDYVKEMAAIAAIQSRYEHEVRDDIERQFMSVDLYPLGRAVAMKAKS